eukprot:TRINITY_DN1281_c0_g1_i1.p1 TRINITY_DN1281_c0_g1~~TRINITY_DN1281_c0_g1_i1.p1  ORF type:complete len:525 (+),score=116.05 TRINITY_DN1281_c0_g1_i1:34-1608(+)
MKITNIYLIITLNIIISFLILNITCSESEKFEEYCVEGRISDFVGWLEEHTEFLSPKLDFYCDKNNYNHRLFLIADEDIEQDELLIKFDFHKLSFPADDFEKQKTFLRESDVEGIEFIDYVRDTIKNIIRPTYIENDEEFTNYHTSFYSLLMHRFAESAKEHSPFYKYLNVLPIKYNTPIFYHKSELKDIFGTQLFYSTITTKEQSFVEREMMGLIQTEAPDVFSKEEYDRNSFKWALQTYRSRSTLCDNESEFENYCFPGYYELLRYDMPQNIEVINNEEDNTIEFRAMKSLPKHTELVASEGHFSDSDMLDFFGYIWKTPTVPSKDYPENNPYNDFLVGVALDRNDNLYGFKKNLLNSLKLKDGQLYGLKLTKGINRNLLNALRVYYISVYESDQAENLFKRDEMISLQNEVSVYNNLLDILEERLSRYDKTYTEDIESLEEILAEKESLLSNPEQNHEDFLEKYHANTQIRQLIQVSISEKIILLHNIALCKEALNTIMDQWDTRDFDIPDVVSVEEAIRM